MSIEQAMIDDAQEILALSSLQEFVAPHLNINKYTEKAVTFSRDLRLNIKVMSLKPDLGLMK